MALQIRRGTDAERTAGGGVVFAEGELVYVTDTDKLFIGDGATAGGMPLAGSAIATLGEYITADTISSTLDLQQNLDLNGKDIIGTGNINIAGTINATGNVNIGDDVNTDTVDFAAKITSSLTPNADATYDLGTTLLKWNNIHAVRLDGDVEGSVFGDDSTLLVDGVNSKIVGAVDTASLRTSESKIALGEEAGNDAQGSNAIAIGYKTGWLQQSAAAVAVGDQAGNLYQGAGSVAVGQTAGKTSQGASAIAIGSAAGQVNQGQAAIAIGEYAGQSDQAANSIIINASGNSVTDGPSGSLVIKPIRDAVGTTVVMYDNSTNEVTHTATPAFDLQGDLTGNVTGNVTGQIKGSGGSAVLAPNTGPADAVLSLLDITATGTIGGNLTGNVTGNAAGDHTGTFVGVITATGTFDGDITGSVFGDDSTLIVDAINKTLTGNVTGNVTGDTAGVHTGNIFTNLIDSADSSAIVITPSLQTLSDLQVDQDLTVGNGGAGVFGPNGTDIRIAPGTGAGVGKVFTDTLEVRTIEIQDGDGGEIFVKGNLDISGSLTTNGGHLGFGGNDLLTFGGTSASLRVAEFTGDFDTPGDFENSANFNNYMTVNSTVADFGTAVQFASMTTTQRDALTAAAGMVVFNTTDTKLQVYTGSTWADLH